MTVAMLHGTIYGNGMMGLTATDGFFSYHGQGHTKRGIIFSCSVISLTTLGIFMGLGHCDDDRTRNDVSGNEEYCCMGQFIEMGC